MREMMFIFSLQRIKTPIDIFVVPFSQRSRKITQKGRLSILCCIKKKSACQPGISISNMTISLQKSSPMLICWLAMSTSSFLLCRLNTIIIPHWFVSDNQKSLLTICPDTAACDLNTTALRSLQSILTTETTSIPMSRAYNPSHSPADL